MDLVDAEYNGDDFTGETMEHSEFVRCRFTGVRFAGTFLGETRISDTEFAHCDLASTDFAQCSLRNVTFVDCRASDANFRMTRLHKVRFDACALVEADFLEAEMTRVAFPSSDCRAINMTGVRATDVDLRGARLDGLKGVSALRGVTIGTDQLVTLAPELALALGLVVLPPDG